MTSNLQGLNLVHPESPPSNLSDAQDLLSTPLFPELAAHLDLWTNVSFASDEPFISARDRQQKEAEVETPHADSLTRKEVAHHFAAPAPSPISSNALPQHSQFDFQRFLAEFGIPPPGSDNLNLQNASGMGTGLTQPDFAATPNSFGAIPSAAPAPSASTSPTTIQPNQSEGTPAPASKRARTTTKTTASSAPSPTTSALPDSSQPNGTPLSASEDKRRRNTAASARFRLKKKEREAALDAKAQALEDRVTSLERECEGLRRENGWLRGLVVGVTGGVVPSMSDVPIGAPATTTTASASSEKRKRDETSA